MKTASSASFESILAVLKEKDINTKAEMMAYPRLYSSYWVAVQDFVNCALLSKSGKKAGNGRQLSGNRYRIFVLESLGFTTREDVQMDCVEQIIRYTDNILKCSTISHQKNYAYAAVNAVVAEICRKTLPSKIITDIEDLIDMGDSEKVLQYIERITIVSLNDTFPGSYSESDHITTFEDYLADYRYTPENLFDCREIMEQLRTEYLHEVTALAVHPSEVMAFLASRYLEMKPREIASMVVENGYKNAFVSVITRSAKVFGILPSEIYGILASQKLMPDTTLTENKDQKVIARHISHLLDRAHNHIRADEAKHSNMVANR